MKKSFLKYIILLLVTVVGLWSCRDDYFDNFGFNDGSDEVTLVVDFMPMAENVLQSRATVAPPGDGMADIKDMCIVLFDKEDKFAGIHKIDPSMSNVVDEVKDRTDADASNGNLAGEVETMRRTIKLRLPDGEYYVYGVANLITADGNWNISKTTYDFLMNEFGIENRSRQEFRSMRRTWDPSNYRNNSEMCGVFRQVEVPGSEVSTPEPGAPDDESPVTVKAGSRLHCWLRRLASKLTVDFDASELSPSTSVYIKSIVVKDIASDCPIIARNTASEGGLIATSSHKIQLCKDADYTDDLTKTINHYKNWPELRAGVPTLAAIAKETKDAEIKNILAGVNHSNSAKALFFYENMQGRGKLKYQDAYNNDATSGIGDTDKEGADGFIDFPDGTDPANPYYKDAVKAGTYVEVQAYYESFDAGNEGSGNIVYRFMLGKNVDDDYNVERNHHYKLTLCLRGHANDYDWHIEYDRSQPPYTIPSEYYISYGYNESTELPISVVGEIVDGIITAEIIRNDWFPSNTWEDSRPLEGTVKGGVYLNENLVTRADATNDPNNLSVGFLSLRKTQHDAVGAGKPLSYNYDLWMGGGDKTLNDYVRNEGLEDDLYNNEKFVPEKYRGVRSLGFRAYKVDLTDQSSGTITYDKGLMADDKDGSYRLWTKPGNANTNRQTTFYLPLYTRNRNLVKTTGYTGENPYNTYQRRAAIRVKFKLKDRNGNITAVEKDVPIIQATKLANPMGIWRDWNSAAPFDVQLKYLASKNATTYTDLTSHQGGWSAEVEQGADWILLNGGKRKIYGGEGSLIHFTFKPAGILSNPKQSRCGIIVVRYHNYSCVHKIFVRQGYAPLKIADGNNCPAWHTTNLVTKTNEETRPTGGGSLFKYGNFAEPIAAINNVVDESPWIDVVGTMFKDHSNDILTIAGSLTTKTWGEIKSEAKGTSVEKMGDWAKGFTLNGVNVRLPNVAECVELKVNTNLKFQFGVLYSDEATETANTVDEAYRYKSDIASTHSYGMRGCFVYNKNDGRQIFFPLGSTGFGKRKESRHVHLASADVPDEMGYTSYNDQREVGRGVLRYSTNRITYMNVTSGYNLPLLYDIFRSFGANYWANIGSDDDPDYSGDEKIRYGLDMNYNTFDFNTIGEELFDGTTKPKNGNQQPGRYSDACPIRLVDAD